MSKGKNTNLGEPTQTESGMTHRNLLLTSSALTASAMLGPLAAVEQAKAQQAATGRRPNILIIWGDDIG